MAQLGMSRLLADGGLEVIEHDGETDLVDLVERLAPDAVVLPLDDSSDVRRRIRSSAPETKVILWARDESEMRVYDAGRVQPRRILIGAADALVSELQHRK